MEYFKNIYCLYIMTVVCCLPFSAPAVGPSMPVGAYYMQPCTGAAFPSCRSVFLHWLVSANNPC